MEKLVLINNELSDIEVITLKGRTINECLSHSPVRLEVINHTLDLCSRVENITVGTVGRHDLTFEVRIK